MVVYAGQEHIIYREPRELLTKVWVQEGYGEYRQVPGSVLPATRGWGPALKNRGSGANGGRPRPGPGPGGSTAVRGWGRGGPSSLDEEGSSTWEEPEVTQPSLQDKLHVKVAALVEFLLLKYRNKQPTRQAEMLEIISKDYQDDSPVILGQASECMRLVFGMDVKKVDRSDHSYILVNVLGLVCDGMLSGEHGMPKTGLLVLVLWVSLLHGDRAPEEEVWETLGVMGVYAGQEHIIYGEPRELFTKVWVQEGYLEYRQVTGSDPDRYEFPWGPRAHADPASFKCWSICSGSGAGSWLPPWPCLKEL
uniref:Melanoma-associated antigen 9-like n=1 Tax=Callorhinus ursinus TaxID=34884 RepID=A0A3Q7N0G2_CALUR|nr:melanoma-associated antigen 9-like [Callorhinus ursinus]